MSNLNIPECWAALKFDDLVSFRTGFAFKSSEYKPSGVLVLRVTNINSDSSIDLSNTVYISQSDFDKKYREFELFENDVLIVMVGATTGKIGLIPNSILPCVLNQNMWRISPKNEETLSKAFIYNYLKYIQKDVLQGAGGSATGFIKQADFKQKEFPLPPLGEQQRIVAKIESTREKVKTIESSISKAEELIEKYRESLLQKAFRGELVQQDPNDEPASKLIERIRVEKAKQSDGKKKKKDELPPIKPEEIPFDIPKSWEWVRLGEVINVVNGFAYSSTKFVDSGIPVIRISNVTPLGVDLSDCVYVDADLFEEKFKVVKGDLLIAMSGATTGKFGLYEMDSDALLNQRVGNLRILDKKTITEGYRNMAIEWLSPDILASAYGGAQPNISGTLIERMLIPLPPHDEQKRIVYLIQQLKYNMHRFRGTLNSLMNYTNSINASILSQAFSGGLVPQIPSEGTGHDLLEKIKSEQSQATEGEATMKSPTSTKKKRANK